MLISVNWLKEILDCDLDPTKIAQVLTNLGLEVSAINLVDWSSTKVVVGEILNAQPHPNADRLQICAVKVSLDSSEPPLQIVCGAPNARTGLKVAVALVGAKLPEITIKPAKLRGIESFGMLCSSEELNLDPNWQQGSAAHGILELDPEAPIGTPLETYLNLPDTVLDIELTPNRGDCLSIIGVARELVAAGVARFKTLDATADTELSAFNAASVARVKLPEAKLEATVLAPELAPNYCLAEIANIDNTKPSPTWLKQRLIAAAIRPINLVVDITNFVMLELGQPLHAFDADKISAPITVRLSKAGETITLLNEQRLDLDDKTLVIADTLQPLAIAGLMGGQFSAISQNTKHIYLESAYFKREQLSLETQLYNLTTDAAYRYERGVDFLLAETALKRATQLLKYLAGANCIKASCLKHEDYLPKRPGIRLSALQITQLLGTSEITLNEAINSLKRLGLTVNQIDTSSLEAYSPSWRFDLSCANDLVEEIARLRGYNTLPVIPISFSPAADTNQSSEHLNQLADKLASRGYLEAISYSFVDPSWQPESHQNIKLENPLFKEGSLMRRYLWASLLPAISYNFQRGNFQLRLFEIGKVFEAGKASQNNTGDIAQPTHLAGLLTGSFAPKQWGEIERKVDFYDLKADLAALFTNLAWQTLPEAGDAESELLDFLHPARAALIALKETGEVIGFAGQLHPIWQNKWQLKQPVWLWEVDLTKVPPATTPCYQELARFPRMTRDLSLIVPETLTWAKIENAITSAATASKMPLILLEPFDLYRGEGLPAGHFSLAVRLVFRSHQETLTDEAVSAWVQEILTALAALNINLREI